MQFITRLLGALAGLYAFALTIYVVLSLLQSKFDLLLHVDAILTAMLMAGASYVLFRGPRRPPQPQTSNDDVAK
jgi:hypothetical protein